MLGHFVRAESLYEVRLQFKNTPRFLLFTKSPNKYFEGGFFQLITFAKHLH